MMHRLLGFVLLVSVSYAQWPGYRPDEKLVEAPQLSDDGLIRVIMDDLLFAAREEKPERALRYVSQRLRNEILASSEKVSFFSRGLEIDSIRVVVTGNKAVVQCSISDRVNVHNKRETIVFEGGSGKWSIISSTFLVRALLQQTLKNSEGGHATVGEENIGGELVSTLAAQSSITNASHSVVLSSFRFSNSALIQRHVPWTDYYTINRSVTKDKIERILFNYPYDMKFVRLPNSSYVLAVASDHLWNRIVFGKTNGNVFDSWLKSYGDHPGQDKLYWASSLTLDKFGNIFVLAHFPTKLVRLKYDDASQNIAFVQNIQLPAVEEPVDVFHDGNWTPDDLINTVWLADKRGNAIFRFTLDGQQLGKYTRVIQASTGEQLTFSGPTKVIANYYTGNTMGIALIDSEKRRVIIIGWVTGYQGDAIVGFYSATGFAPETNARLGSIGFFPRGTSEELWVADESNGMFHIFDGHYDDGYLASVRSLGTGQQQWLSPRALTTTGMSNSNGDYLDAMTLDQWDDTRGLNVYLPGADIVDFKATYTTDGIRFEYKLTNTASRTSQIYNQNNQLVHQFASSQYARAGQRIDAIQWSQLGTGSFSFRVSVLPYHNASYGQYQQSPVQISQAFSRPLSVSISGPDGVFHTCCKGQPANRYTWTANVSGGTSPYTYSWLRDGSQVSTGSSYTEYFSFNGWGGGSYEFTLRVDVRDAQNTLASATMVVTAYSSGGDGGGPVAQDGTLIEQLVLPTEFSMSQNYPNPFNPETQIVFGLPEPSHVTIVISDIIGRQVLTVQDGELPARYHYKRWAGVDASGQKVGSGIYFCRILAKGESGKEFTKVMKLILLK